MAQPLRKLKFEDAMKRLDQIVEAMERGEVGIEDAIKKYEEAMALKAHCQRILDDAEQRIRKIQLGADGSVELSELEAPAEDAADENESSG